MSRSSHINNIIDTTINRIRNIFNDNIYIYYNFADNSIHIKFNFKDTKDSIIYVEKWFKYYNEKDDDDERYVYYLYANIVETIEDNWLKLIYK